MATITTKKMETRQLRMDVLVDERIVKSLSTTFNENGLSNGISEYCSDEKIYKENRIEIRKKEREFRNTVDELEETLISALESKAEA